jgi:hypothetical protein
MEERCSSARHERAAGREGVVELANGWEVAVVGEHGVQTLKFGGDQRGTGLAADDKRLMTDRGCLLGVPVGGMRARQAGEEPAVVTLPDSRELGELAREQIDASLWTPQLRPGVRSLKLDIDLVHTAPRSSIAVAGGEGDELKGLVELAVTGDLVVSERVPLRLLLRGNPTGSRRQPSWVPLGA